MSNPVRDLKSIFGHAVELESAEERDNYLAKACGDNAALRAEIDELLKALDRAGEFMQSPAAVGGGALVKNTVSYHPVTEVSGTVIGPYKLLEQIGAGGMGVVYMADQQSPIQRRVALKIIKPGLDSRQVIARFEAERQALALMDHPNIAKVFDASTTESERPYFVMELVRGIPITEYCDQNNLSVPERLELFNHVCHAVQHAHQKGIIHRDLKPSNVLVTLHDGRPVPKVIDFGVAKAINQRLTEKTLFTNFTQMVGTPLYMSPEQAEMSGLDIDTRSDIYSLGVLLYELLTSTTPFNRQRMQEAAFDEIRRIIREEEPPRPSTRVSTLGETRTATAAHRKADPNRLSQMLKGELDWVVMKALEKDRTHRYETANGLARDIQRYLADQPVEACPPSAAYRFRKFSRRNRTALATALLVAVALFVGILGSTWQAVRATRAERLAETRLIAETEARTEADLAREAEVEQRRLAESQRVKAEEQRAAAEANFQKARKTVDEYFTLVSEDKLLDVPGLQPLRKDLLESALRFYKSSAVERTDDPAVLADLATTYLRVGVVYHLIDRNDDAVAAVDKALEVIDQLQQKFPEAREQRRRLGGYWTGHRPTQQGTELPSDGDAAFRSLMRLNATWQSLSEEFPAEASFRSDLAANYYLIGDLLATAGQAINGVGYFEQAKEMLLQLVRDVPDNPEYRADLARVHEQLTRNMPAADRAGETEAECRAGLALREQLVVEFPDSPQHRRDLVNNLGQYIPYIEARDPAEAERLIHRLIELAESLAREYPNVDLYRSELASAHARVSGILLDRGQLAEALEESRLATRLGPKVWFSHDQLRRILNTIGDSEKTLAVMRENAQLSPNSEPAHHQYGLALKEQGRLDEAVREFERGLEIIPNTPWSHYHIAEIRLRQNKLPEALDAARSAVRINPNEYQFRARLLEVLNKIGDAEKTLAVMRENAQSSPDSEPAHHLYGLALKEQGRLDEAVREFERGLEINPDTPWSHYRIAGIRLRQKRLPEALDAARSAVRLNPNEYQFRVRLLEVLNKIAIAGDEEALKELALLSEEVRRELTNVDDPQRLNHFAWSLVVSQDIRPKIADMAVQAAVRACELRPRTAFFLNTLGVALYRKGDYAAAIESLKRSRYCDDYSNALLPALDCYFLAMSNAKLHHAEFAEKWFQAADLWTALFAATDGGLEDFRQEAIDVLGIEAEPMIAAPITAEAEQELVKLFKTADPDAGWMHCWLGARLAERGDWAEANEQLNLAGRFEEDAKAHGATEESISQLVFDRALLCVQTKQLDAYRQLCQTAVEGIGQTSGAQDPARIGIQCKLAPDALEDYTPVLKLLENAINAEPNNWLIRGVRAHLLYRSGDAEVAVKQLEQIVSSDKAMSLNQPYNQFFLAMAHHDLGNETEAQRYLREGAKWIDRDGRLDLQKGAVVSEPLAWRLRLDLRLLRAEAEQLLGITQPDAIADDLPAEEDMGENPES